MCDVEKLSEVAMEMISYAGMAKSCYLEALSQAKKGDFDGCAARLQDGDKNFIEAHHAHFDVLHQEVETREPQISLLMTHAEDQLMGAEMMKTLIVEIIDLYKEKKNG